MLRSRLEKGGFPLEGINLALCENPLPPVGEAIEAAKSAAYLSNHYTEPYSRKLKEKISNYIKVPVENIHINAGSELILRQLFLRYGRRVHLMSPTYYLFEEIAENKTYTLLDEREDFLFDMRNFDIPEDTTLAVIVNPNNPTETYFFLGEVPRIDADQFAKALSEKNIHIRPLHLERLGNNLLRFATSTPENNQLVLNAIREIVEST
jgi:histidinol-phosphate aminotransferase